MSKHNSKQSSYKEANRLLESVSGPIRFNMTNDYMFKEVLQENNHVLKSLIADLLHLTMGGVKSVTVTNPIEPGDKIDDKAVILDVNVLFNNSAFLDLEMQVANLYNWVERSTYYLCRNFTNLHQGDDYSAVKPSYQIGFLSFTLFPDDPCFYATNLLMNEKTHKIYTDKLRVSVIDLTRIDLATEEDRFYKIDTWAQFFKATTWEEVKILAAQNPILAEAGATIYKISQEEHQRQILEGREDAIRQELGVQRLLEKTKKERDEAAAKLDDTTAKLGDATAKLDAAYALLRMHGIDPNEASS